jgi:phage terminase large subunit
MNESLTESELTLFQEEPVDFIELAFSDALTDYQQAIATSVRDNTYTAVRSCHGAGKSHIAARIALWFLYSHPDSKVVTTAPTWRQVEDILWRELRDAHTKAKVQLGGKPNNTSLNLGEQWFATGLSTDDPDRFQGYHAVDVLLICDEASGIEEAIYNASEGIVSSQHARVLYIGNPTNTTGTFYKAFKLPGYGKIHISAFDTPNFTAFGITLEDIRAGTWQQKITADLPRPYLITPEWVADKYLRWGEGNPMWDSRVMGEFPIEGEDTLIPLRYIEAARTRHLPVKADDPEQIGQDYARFGSDRTEFCYRKGPKPLEWRTYSHQDTMATAQKSSAFIELYPSASTVVDEIGLGAGVYDRLLQLLPNREILGANVGMPAFDTERFANLRAEIHWGLRERFIQGDIDLTALPQDVYDDLSAQLSAITFKYTTRGQIQIESKQDMKKRGLPSPDKCLAEGTLVLTSSGYRAIETIKPGDRVITPFGTRRVLAAACTNPNASVMRIDFSNGASLVGTPTHKLPVKDSLISFDALTLYNEVFTDSLWQLLKGRLQNLLYFKGTNTGYRQRIDGITPATSDITGSALDHSSIESSGSTTTSELSPRDTWYTISIETLSIITLKISRFFQRPNTSRCTLTSGSLTRSFLRRISVLWKKHKLALSFGTSPRQPNRSIRGCLSVVGRSSKQRACPAKTAVMPSMPTFQAGQSFAHPVAGSNPRVKSSGTLPTRSPAPSVRGSTRHLDITPRAVVVTRVQTDYGFSPVYNLTVEKDGEPPRVP